MTRYIVAAMSPIEQTNCPTRIVEKIEDQYFVYSLLKSGLICRKGTKQLQNTQDNARRIGLKFNSATEALAFIAFPQYLSHKPR